MGASTRFMPFICPPEEDEYGTIVESFTVDAVTENIWDELDNGEKECNAVEDEEREEDDDSLYEDLYDPYPF
ncbi:unnamed protein product [Caenorhabditis sp. 36 PRJEB53466]|nr:unnamed protein product [Caenorhabditis sp. 36 PRJEB53466]